jgi:hypothetical protein
MMMCIVKCVAILFLSIRVFGVWNRMRHSVLAPARLSCLRLAYDLICVDEKKAEAKEKETLIKEAKELVRLQRSVPVPRHML